MDRFWFFTWRTHGTWLPGEAGFVGDYETPDRLPRNDNVPGFPAGPAMPALAVYAADILKEPPVYLSGVQAEAVFRQMTETAEYRSWRLDAVAVMADHVHVVFGVPGDPEPSDMLRDWKSYTSRALNRLSGKRQWWVDGGSKRPLKTEEQWVAVVRYVRDQDRPLVVWLSADALARVGGPGEPAA